MNTTIIKFNSLADTVRSAAKNHNFRFSVPNLILIRRIVGRIIVSTVLCSAYMDALPGFFYPKLQTAIAYILLRDFQNLTQVFIRKSILLCRCQKCVIRQRTFISQKFFLFFNKLFHLFDKIMLYFCNFKKLFCCRALSQSFVHKKMTLTGRSNQPFQQFLFCQGIKILHVSKSVTSGLKTADCFLERFFICLADTHYLSNRAHLRSKLIFYPFKFLKCPAGKLDYNIISIRHIFIQSSIFSTWNIRKRKSGRKHCRYKSNRKTGRL